MSRKIAFLDLEASGLGPRSWPIEVGWGFCGAPAEAILIEPHAAWPLDQWDKNAEALHGISYDTVTKVGRPAKEVCERLNGALASAEVYSDAPDWDGFWLLRLYKAGGVEQAFELRDFERLLAPMVGGDLRAVSREAEKTHPHNHRAGDDVSHMLAVYKIACERAGAT